MTTSAPLIPILDITPQVRRPAGKMEQLKVGVSTVASFATPLNQKFQAEYKAAATAAVLVFRDSEATELLNANPLLKHLIKQASRELRKYFPTEKLVSEVLVEPDGSAQERLALFVYTDLDPDEAFDRLKAFDQNLLLDAPMTPESDLLVHVRFNEF